LFIALRQQGYGPGEAEIPVVAVQPDRRRRKADTFDEGELHGLRALRAIDLDRLADRDACMAVRQQVDPLRARGNQRLDVLLARQPRTAVGAVAPRPERSRSGIDRRLPMGSAAAIDTELLGRVPLIGEATNRDCGRA